MLFQKLQINSVSSLKSNARLERAPVSRLYHREIPEIYILEDN